MSAVVSDAEYGGRWAERKRKGTFVDGGAKKYPTAPA
jgi:hypothetical protein